MNKKLAYTQTLGYKLIISYFITTLLILAIALFISLKIVKNNYAQMVHSQFHDILQMHEHLLEQNFIAPETWAKHLSNEEGIQHILSNKQLSLKKVDTFLSEHNIIFFENTFINILNAKGEVIYCSSDCDYLGRSLLDIDIIRQASNFSIVKSAIVNDNNKFAFYSVAPVFDKDSTINIIGFIIVGKIINNEYMNSIKIMDNDIEIAIIRDRAVMASTISINGEPLINVPMPYLEYLDLLKNNEQINEIKLQQQNHFILAKKIKRMSYGVSGSIMLLKPKKELEDIKKNLINNFMYLVLLSLLIIFIISNGITKHLLTPISRLTNTSIKIAQGQQGIKAEVESDDEIGLLAQNFNAMLTTIEQQHTVIVDQNESLEERVLLRTSELNQAMDELLTLTVAIEQSPVGMLITNRTGIIEYVNPMFTEISGYTKEDALGQTSSILKSENTTTEQHLDLWQQISSGKAWEGELYNQSKDGHFYWERLLITPIINKTGEITHYLGSMEDITQIKKYEKKLIEQASHDSLTGLPNRFLAEERLNQAVSGLNEQGAILFIDLDEFKKVNDTLGHHAGDELLKKVASEMLLAVRKNDTVARLGGDEFLIILNHIHQHHEIEVIAKKIITLASQEFIINKQSVLVSASIGIAQFPDDDSNADHLMSKADSAMYIAKNQGKNCFHFFSS
ncbi:MAG: diguanylate cyclase [Gammaproteobacteria bacterium]|nr:diguanylate cyclase [Gammaproteobacteria bacterium]